MKRYLAILVGTIGVVCTLNAQTTNDDRLIVPREMLTQEQLSELERTKQIQTVTENLAAANEWAGMGKEIGTAVNEGLGAVTTQASRFADTTPGKFTMFLIAWKVMSEDLVTLSSAVLGVVVGLPFLVFANCLLILIWRRATRQQRVLISISKIEGKKYELRDTWFTKDKGATETDYRTTFIVFWWISLFAANILIFSTVIF